MIVLDANILIRAVLGRRVWQLIDTYAAKGGRFFAPDVAFADAEKYLPPLLEKRGKPHDLSGSLGFLRNIIEPVTPELYAVFEGEARLRLRGRDENDWPVLATAISGFPYALPSSVSCKSFACHSYENTKGVGYSSHSGTLRDSSTFGRSDLQTFRRVSDLSPFLSNPCALYCIFLHPQETQPVSFQCHPHSSSKNTTCRRRASC